MPAWVKPHARALPAEHTLGVVAGIVGNGPKGPLRKMMRNAYRADRRAGVPHFEGCEDCHAECRLIVKGSKTVYSDDGQAEAGEATRCNNDTVKS